MSPRQHCVCLIGIVSGSALRTLRRWRVLWPFSSPLKQQRERCQPINTSPSPSWYLLQGPSSSWTHNTSWDNPELQQWLQQWLWMLSTDYVGKNRTYYVTGHVIGSCRRSFSKRELKIFTFQLCACRLTLNLPNILKFVACIVTSV